MSSKSGILLLLIPLLMMSLAHATSQQHWDLSIDRITVLPLNGEVQQGQPLTLTIYIRNKESKVTEDDLGRELGRMRRPGKIPRWVRDYSELKEWAISLLKSHGETFSRRSTDKE
ncbi:MAG: hypothetical protein QI199_02605 [Candidatus Korarchaeota archaeon]|nr:hypothetical protein [Candidatus Korarchaeota archaeon]